MNKQETKSNVIWNATFKGYICTTSKNDTINSGVKKDICVN